MLTDLMVPDFGTSLMDSVFSDFNNFIKSPKFNFDDAFPPINLYMMKTDNQFYLEMALTGYKKDWLTVSLEGMNLIIKADVPECNEDDKQFLRRRRIKAVSFEKTYRIPDGFDTDKLDITYEDGLLSISAPTKTAEARKIEIK